MFGTRNACGPLEHADCGTALHGPLETMSQHLRPWTYHLGEASEIEQHDGFQGSLNAQLRRSAAQAQRPLDRGSLSRPAQLEKEERSPCMRVPARCWLPANPPNMELRHATASPTDQHAKRHLSASGYLLTLHVRCGCCESAYLGGQCSVRRSLGPRKGLLTLTREALALWLISVRRNNASNESRTPAATFHASGADGK